MRIRECYSCGWTGWEGDCVNPEHAQSLCLCPECDSTTEMVTPERVVNLRLEVEATEGAYDVVCREIEKLQNENLKAHKANSK